MADEDNTKDPATPSTVLSKTTRLKTRVRYPKIDIVIDAKRINDACNCTVDKCLIREAIAEAYPHLTNIIVDTQTIAATDPEQNLRFTWLTPRFATWCIIEIDQGVHPNPFLLRLRKPIRITRSGGKHRHLTREQARSVHASRQREYRKIKRTMAEQQEGNETQEQKEHAARVVSNMRKRNAPLGPIVALTGANASRGSAPIIVGGRPPRPMTHAHLLRTRRFGARVLKDNPS